MTNSVTSSTTAINHDFTHLQDVMGTLPMVKRYIVLCLCFQLDEQQYSKTSVESHLTTSLQRLADAFPYLAGQVILEGQTATKSAIPQIRPLSPYTIQLISNDLRDRDDMFTWAQMEAAGFPFAVLDPNIVAPPVASAWTTDESGMTAPVMLLQANFVKGGLLLLLAGNHMIMDMTGLGSVISLFAKACREETFTEEEIQLGNQSRRNAVPLFGDDHQLGDELEDVMVRHADDQPNFNFESPPLWAYFNFSAENLARLKQEASQQTLVPYISTDDAVGALCWQRIARVRESRLGSGTQSTFVRPISVRNYLGLKGYIGHMVDCVYEHETNVWRRSVGEIAARLRALLRQEDRIIHHIRAFATILNRLDDKSKLINGARVNPTKDLVLSSYANIKCCELSFGKLLAKPSAARRPRMSPWPSLAYMMPKASNGDIAVALCLEENDMMKLRQDKEFTSYATFIG